MRREYDGYIISCELLETSGLRNRDKQRKKNIESEATRKQRKAKTKSKKERKAKTIYVS